MSTSRSGKPCTTKIRIGDQGKLDAIRRVHDGESKASVARNIGVPESTLRGWCKNKDKILYNAMQTTRPEKKRRIDNSNMEPYNLSLKDNTFSREQNSIKNESQTVKIPVKMNTTVESRFAPDNMREQERNRAELARMSVNLGLNRPETFMSRSQNSPNLEDPRAVMHMFYYFTFLLNLQKLQQGMVDASTHAVPSASGSHTMAPQDKMKYASTSNLLNKDQQNTENVLVNGENSQISKSADSDINRSRTVLDNILINNINNVEVNKEEATHREAIEHGDKFLNWLGACSDPTITVVQVTQFKKLLENVKLGAKRKYGDMQNKTE